MVSISTLDTPTLVALALRYPTPDGLVTLRTGVDALPRGGAEREMRRFLKSIDAMTYEDLEVLYTATFDLSCGAVVGVQQPTAERIVKLSRVDQGRYIRIPMIGQMHFAAGRRQIFIRPGS